MHCRVVFVATMLLAINGAEPNAQPTSEFVVSVECCADGAAACTCQTVSMLSGSSWTTPLYALVRDTFGNYVEPSQDPKWEARDSAVSLAVDPDTAYKVVLTGADEGGVTWVVCTDTVLGHADSVQVTVTPSSVRHGVGRTPSYASRGGPAVYHDLRGRVLGMGRFGYRSGLVLRAVEGGAAKVLVTDGAWIGEALPTE